MEVMKKTKDGHETENENTNKDKSSKDLAATELTSEEMAKMTVEAIIQRAGPMDHRQNMIEYFNSCSICGAELDFTHVTQFQYGEVTEEGFCPCCEVRLKNEVHRLQ